MHRHHMNTHRKTSLTPEEEDRLQACLSLSDDERLSGNNPVLGRFHMSAFEPAERNSQTESSFNATHIKGPTNLQAGILEPVSSGSNKSDEKIPDGTKQVKEDGKEEKIEVLENELEPPPLEEPSTLPENASRTGIINNWLCYGHGPGNKGALCKRQI